MNWRWRWMLATTISMLGACQATLEGPAVVLDATPESEAPPSFDEILDESRLEELEQDSGGGVETPGTPLPPAELPPDYSETPEEPTPEVRPDMLVGIGPQVGILSTCHPGEANYMEGITVPLEGYLDSNEHDALLSFEAADGTVLAAVSLGLDGLLADMRSVDPAVGTMRIYGRDVGLRVPGRIFAPDGTFEMSIFVCVDTTHDLRCGDEPLAELTGRADEWKTRSLMGTVAHVGVRATAIDGTLRFTKLGQDAGTGSTAFGQAASWAGGVLANYGGSEQTAQLNELSVLLALQQQGSEEECANAPRINGCFAEGTRLLSASGSAVAVEELVRGLPLRRADGGVGRVVRVVAGPEAMPLVSLQTDTGHGLVVTQDHPMVTARGLMPASAMALGETLQVYGGAEARVVSLSSVAPQAPVYNLELEGESLAHHTVVAEGLATGDLVTQGLLAAESSVVARAP